MMSDTAKVFPITKASRTDTPPGHSNRDSVLRLCGVLLETMKRVLGQWNGNGGGEVGNGI